jgi:hypothetical protein
MTLLYCVRQRSSHFSRLSSSSSAMSPLYELSAVDPVALLGRTLEEDLDRAKNRAVRAGIPGDEKRARVRPSGLCPFSDEGHEVLDVTCDDNAVLARCIGEDLFVRKRRQLWGTIEGDNVVSSALERAAKPAAGDIGVEQ